MPNEEWVDEDHIVLKPSSKFLGQAQQGNGMLPLNLHSLLLMPIYVHEKERG